MVYFDLAVDRCIDAALFLFRAVFCAFMHGTQGRPMIWCRYCYMKARWPRMPR